ncbi:uncharacterized protein LOC141807171 [Halichoeres trimaculatus]|uniref:uncharacterized protein LOC141807171 n=1 Tax=Halichoeres trimaculatus TaxID=147232 RepID=UPI003D9EF601
MSFSFCCTSPSEEGFRRHPLQDEEEEEEEESKRRSINVSELREEYRSSRERQRRDIQVLIYRTVSVELKDAISIIPINQSLTSPCGLCSSSLPTLTLEGDPASCDPWMVPLDLHQHSSSRRSLSSSKTVSSKHHMDPPSSSSSDVDHISTSRMDLIQSPVFNSPCDGFNNEMPITSPPSSTASSLDVDLKENWSPSRHTCNSTLKNSSSAWRGSRKFSAPPSFRLTRQLSVGGVGQNQNFPFPCRKTRRISEAVRRLGMYSSI